MMDQWRADLQLLRAWYPDHETLADELGVGPATVQKYAKGGKPEPTGDLKEDVRQLRARMEDQHNLSAERVTMIPRILAQLQKARNERSWERIDQLIDRIGTLLDQKDDITCEL